MSSKEQLKVIHTGLDHALDKQAEALPQNFNKHRFLQNCMTVLQDNDFSKCETTSVVRTMLKGAFLGLDFFNKECYAIPYGTNVQFQTDYKGEIKLCKKYSINPIKDIYAKVVREADEFAMWVEDGKQHVVFKPLPFNDNEIRGAFAVCYFTDGSMLCEAMSVKEIESTRQKFSKQPNGKAWRDSTAEMYKKTVLRRLCKNIELDFESIEQKYAFDEGADFDMNKAAEKQEAEDVFAVETEATVVEEDGTDGTEQQ